MSGRRPLRLLHTSDIHVAGDGPSADGLRLAIDAALDAAVDVVLIAGDLFDSARVADEAVEETLKQLSRLTMPVVAIPGNHDCVDERSIYRRVRLEDAGAHVTFVGDPAGRSIVFEDLGLTVWARGIEDHHPGHRPLVGCPPGKDGWWNVVMTHGHYAAGPEDAHRSSRITGDEIASLDCDYLALGHWHRFVDLSRGDVTAAYCGSPSDGAGVLLVGLHPERGVELERVGATGR